MDILALSAVFVCLEKKVHFEFLYGLVVRFSAELGFWKVCTAAALEVLRVLVFGKNNPERVTRLQLGTFSWQDDKVRLFRKS